MRSKPPSSIEPWKTLHSKYVLQTPYITVRKDQCELSDRSVIDDFYIIEREDTVGIVALTPNNEVVMNWQYKHGAHQVLLEIPAGRIDTGEDPAITAARELEEETGYISDEFVLLHTMFSGPTSENNRYFIFLALNARPAGTREENPLEVIETELIPLSEVKQYIQDRTIQVIYSLVGLYMAQEWLAQNHNS